MIIQGSLTLEPMKAKFLGYSSTKQACRCYNIRSHKIIESVNVIVDDTKPRRIQIQGSMDDKKVDDKRKRESTQKEDNSEEEEEEEEERVEEEESHESENEESPRPDTNTPYRWVHKNHPEN